MVGLDDVTLGQGILSDSETVLWPLEGTRTGILFTTASQITIYNGNHRPPAGF